jgi:MFS family permease
MDLENIWQQHDNGDNALNALLDRGHFSKLQSRMPLKKLKNNLLIGIAWAVLITIGYIIAFFFISLWQVYIALGILIIFNIIIMIDSWKLYRRTPSVITLSNSLKQELLLHYTSFQQWWSVQEKISLFVYPVAVVGGFILGGVLGSGKPVEAFLYNGKMLGILGITVIVLVPLCYFGARWMFNYAYGRYLKQLKATIDDLE